MAEHSAYAVLGLQKGASEHEIKQAYVQLVKKYDPEVHTDRFMLVQNAFNRLKDPRKRAKEDLLTYNMAQGELLFDPDERPADHKSPDESMVAGARERYRSSAGDAAAREHYVRLLMQRSYVHAQRKLWDEALHDWEEITQVDPSHVRARNNLILATITLGTSYALHALEDDAIELWERALELNPDNVDLIHNLALASEKANRPDKAAVYWAEVLNRWKLRLKREPDNEYLRECIIEAHRHHGLQYIPAVQKDEKGQPTAASKQERYKAVLEFSPDDFDARYQLATSYLEERRYDEALRELEDLHRKHPRNVEVLNLLGWAELNSGAVDRAFGTWNRSLTIDPKNPQTRENIVKAHLTLGKQYRQKGMFTPALVHLKKLQRFLPQSAEVLMEIAATYDMKGDMRSARQHYEQVITLDPKNKLARKALTDLRMKR